jgi:hypothetical protein
MLPSLHSSNSRYARTLSRDAHLGRHDSWQQGRCHQGKSWQRRAEAAAKADARRRALGHLVTGALIAVAFAMASVAMQRESRQEQLQPIVQQFGR